jgi:hypothetical protein
MDANIKKLDEVWTSDDKKLGVVQALFHRPEEEVDPAVKYYASYVEVENFMYGSDYFVPTDFIAGRDEGTDVIRLEVSFKEVMERTWFRMPDFIARGRARKEKLQVK